MKKIALVACILAIVFAATSGKPKAAKRTVVYASSVDCEHCEKKVMENIAFEKGVKDVWVDLDRKTVAVVFDEAKTDTLKLANSLRKLGYEASVLKFE